MTDLPHEQAVAAALRLVLEAHQRYLNDEPGGVRLNLRGANLADADMIGVDMTGALMIRADMTEACMRGARMTGARMRDADMTEADMTGARMAGADFRGTLLHQQAAELICSAPTAPSTHLPSQP